MDEQPDIRQQAVAIISTALGEETGELYGQYYKTKSLSEVLTSLRELLREHMGEKKAFEVTEQLYRSYHHETE